MSTGGNPFATNNSGGGVGIQTAQPSLTGGWQNPTAGAGFQYAMPGQQMSTYNTPDWIQAGLYNANQPIQNYPITNYGRWNMTPTGGNTNGYGMGASPWPAPNTLFPPAPQNGQIPGVGGQPGQPPTGDNFQPSGSLSPTNAAVLNSLHPTGVTPRNFNAQAVGPNGMTAGAKLAAAQQNTAAMLQNKAAGGNTNALARLIAMDPSMVQQAGSAFAGSPNQGSWLQDNPYITNSLTMIGAISPQTINSLLAGDGPPGPTGTPFGYTPQGPMRQYHANR